MLQAKAKAARSTSIFKKGLSRLFIGDLMSKINSVGKTYGTEEMIISGLSTAEIARLQEAGMPTRIRDGYLDGRVAAKGTSGISGPAEGRDSANRGNSARNFG